jgi:hypothetical protein
VSIEILELLFGVVHPIDDGGNLDSIGRREELIVVRLVVLIGVIFTGEGVNEGLENADGLLVTLQGADEAGAEEGWTEIIQDF